MAHVDEAARQLSKSGSTLYAVLELKKGASPEDVKKAYRHLSSCVLCSPVAVAAAAAVFAVEHLSHHPRKQLTKNMRQMSSISLQGQDAENILEEGKMVLVMIISKR
uniref:DnaJ heat shock protein family (Hsp40) member C5 gamma n=1 Tax=Moschus moschiferus TaxID=68415 RepID=A0A8C6D3S4_MOSMO